MKEIRRLKCEDASEIQRELGYTHRAIEDLSKDLRDHMASEEIQLAEYRRERQQDKKEIDQRFQHIEKKVEAVEKSTAGLKVYILGITIVGSILAKSVDDVDELFKVFIKIFNLL
jgi:chromosome segregation ATPase